MRTSYLVLAALLTAMPASAFAQDAKPAAPAAAMAPMQVNDPQQFANMAAVSNMFEIQSSQLALTKATDQKAKDFAQHMVDDHTKAGDEMKAAADAQGGVTVPPNLNSEAQAKLDKLNAASGADFDKAYLDMQLDGHQKTVALFQGYAQSGPDGALKDFAKKTLPTLQDHLKMISDLDGGGMAAGDAMAPANGGGANTDAAAQPAGSAMAPANGGGANTDAAAQPADAMTAPANGGGANTDAAAQPADTTTAAAATSNPDAAPANAAPMSSILATGYTTTDKDNLSTEIVGAPVYSGPAQDAEKIGDINNLVIGDDGKVAAVIIGVGGFLGIGEKNVAVNYTEMQWVTAEDKSERYVLPTTKDALQAAPDFKTTDEAGK